MVQPLFRAHEPAFVTLFQEVEQAAREQPAVPVGSPGSIVERRKGRHGYYYRQYYDAAGHKTDEYIGGPAGTPQAEAARAAAEVQIALAKRLIRNVRSLAREGFHVIDAKAGAVLAVLHHRGVFAGGALLIGSHAYGALLNHLGVRAAAYVTEDVDIARGAPLSLAAVPDGGLLAILRESGIPFVEIPGLDPRQPAVSFKPPGHERLHVDLLVPSDDESIHIVPVPELGTHAQALPYLRYLIAESLASVVLTRDGVVPVRLPLPERFVVHKLVTSRLRANRSAKAEKDLGQAIVLGAALEDRYPGAVDEAAPALPASARRHLRAGAALALRRIGENPTRFADTLMKLSEGAG